MRFKNRRQAGQMLAEKLKAYANLPDTLVLALPRGGVPVAYEVAAALHAPLDVLIVRKLGVPGHEEMAMGAIASGGVRVMNQEIVKGLGIPEAMIERVTERENQELVRRETLYRDNRPFPDLTGRTVILVDDGLATGATMWAAVTAVRQMQPARLMIGVPAASSAVCADFAEDVDQIVCVITPENFGAVGLWYEQFEQTSDEEVRTLLRQATEQLMPDR